MPPAQKPRNHATKRRQSTASSRKSALIWYGSGLASGVLASLLAALSFWPIAPTAVIPPAAQSAAATVPATKSSEGAGKPRFDFYTVLHDQEVRVSEDDPVLAGSKGTPPATVTTPALPAGAEKSAAPGSVAIRTTPPNGAAEPGKPLVNDKTAASETAKERYLLQVGSFTQLEEADRLRAQLLLLGLQATIQKIPREGQTWHRVQVGPFSSQDQLNNARRAMNQQQIESIVLKLR